MRDMNEARSMYIDLTTAAAEYNISKRSFWSLIAQNKLTAYQPTRTVLIRRSELERFIESKRVNADLDKLINEVVGEVLR